MTTLGAIPSVPAIPPIRAADVRAALPANLQASWDANAANYNASAAAQAGANAALALASGKFDNSTVVHAFSGAIATVPGAGPVLAGMAEFFYAYGAAIGEAFGNLFGLIHCNKDDRSPAAWTANAHVSPKPGTFAAVVVPMIALAWSDAAACREGAHGLPYKPCSVLIPAAVAAWNAIATGPMVDYFVPYLNSADCTFLNLMKGTHVDSGFLWDVDQGPYAFAPLSEVPKSMQVNEGIYWARVRAKAGPLAAAPKALPKKEVALHLGPHPVPAKKTVALHLGTKTAAAAPAYAPYPARGAVHGLGLGRAHGGHGGRPHAPPLRGGRPMRRGFGWNADGTWWYPWPYEPADGAACAAWGDPVEVSPPMQTVGEVQLRNSGGRPAAVRCADGTVYRFAVEGGELTMRPCTAVSSTLGAVAAEPLYFLYRSTVPAGGWAVVGGWFSVADAQDQMASVLKSAPLSLLGAYVWDGQAMRWQPFT
jgi:hypothetical protein